MIRAARRESFCTLYRHLSSMAKPFFILWKKKRCALFHRRVVVAKSSVAARKLVVRVAERPRQAGAASGNARDGRFGLEVAGGATYY
jgi:hypothetical protein